MTQPNGGRRWLILVHQLPAHPSNLRVRVWRRLQQVGAAVLRNALYVLPATDEAREDFNWVREEIVASGGQVSVLEASAVDGYTEGELVEQFRQARAADYKALVAEVRELRTRRSKRAAPRGIDRDVRKLRERFAAVQRRDYFTAPGRADVEQAFAELERHDGAARDGVRATLKRRDFARRTWVTRPRPGIDRVASAWLIRRFIAGDARFAFAATAKTVSTRQIPFDMPDVDFGHHGSHCTFETLMHRFGLDEPAVVSVARVVHDLDLKETRYGMPESAAIGRVVEGLRAAYDEDAKLLEQGMIVIDALYRSFASDGRGRTRVK